MELERRLDDVLVRAGDDLRGQLATIMQDVGLRVVRRFIHTSENRHVASPLDHTTSSDVLNSNDPIPPTSSMGEFLRASAFEDFLAPFATIPDDPVLPPDWSNSYTLPAEFMLAEDLCEDVEFQQADIGFGSDMHGVDLFSVL